MVQGHLAPDDIVLYFTYIENGGSRLEALKVDDFGNISNWPRNFFGDEMGDLVALAHPKKPPILNAVDADWWDHQKVLAKKYEVRIHFLCPDFMSKHTQTL
jgi:hypothetical protein